MLQLKLNGDEVEHEIAEAAFVSLGLQAILPAVRAAMAAPFCLGTAKRGLRSARGTSGCSWASLDWKPSRR
eukprot:5820398-Pyramimonas_sp.AAC.1